MSLLEDMREVHRSILELENLFKIDHNSTKLDAKRREEYYTVTAKVLYFGQRTNLPNLLIYLFNHLQH